MLQTLDMLATALCESFHAIIEDSTNREGLRDMLPKWMRPLCPADILFEMLRLGALNGEDRGLWDMGQDSL